MQDFKAITLKDLKEEILNKKISKNFMVFKYEKNKFLCNQYIQAISEILNLNIQYIENIEECTPDTFFNSIDNNLYIYDVDILNIDDLQTENMQSILDNNVNLIIVCNEIENEFNTIGIGIDNIQFNTIIFPELLEWQILDYFSQICKLDKEKIKWLYDISKKDIYRLNNEIQKIKIFNDFEQDNLFNQINEENGYTDLSNYNIFNLTNVLLKRDYNAVKDVLHDIEYIDVEPLGLVTIMIKNIKNVIDIQLDATATPEKLNMQKKQFIAISYNCGKYNSTELINLYKFLLDVDYKLKTGQLPFNNNRFLDYLICNILNGGLLV